MLKFKLVQFCNKYKYKHDQFTWVVKRLDLANNPNVFLAGGAVRRVLSGEKLDSDFDLFFKSGTDYEAFKLKMPGKFVKANQYNDMYEVDGHKVQLIHLSYYDSIESLFDSFDFTICQFAYMADTMECICPANAFYDLARKRLVVNKITYPVASLRRMFKYAKQGFYACDGALFNFLKDSANLINEPDQMEMVYID